MSRKSTINNTEVSDTIISNLKISGFTPEFEKLLAAYGYAKTEKCNITENNTVKPNSIIQTQSISIKAKITNNHPITTQYHQHMPVQPIPKEYIQKAKDYFYNPHNRYHINDIRDYCYFTISINTARRAGDILNLKVCDILDKDHTIKEHMIIHEQKTDKLAEVKLNSVAKAALTEYINSKDKIDMNDYLFQNYKTGDKLTVDGARKIIKKMAKAIGLNETGLNFGTHSLRKTWAKEVIDNNPNNNVAELAVSQALNHSSISSTRHYIGRTQNEMDMLFENNAL